MTGLGSEKHGQAPGPEPAGISSLLLHKWPGRPQPSGTWSLCGTPGQECHWVQLLTAPSPPSDPLALSMEGPDTDTATHQSMPLPRVFGVRDTLQMVWVLKGESLVTAPLSSNVQPVSLAVLPCTGLPDKEKGNLVYLGIHGTHLSLCCAETQGQPALQVKEQEVMGLYQMNTAQKPFLFFHHKEGSTSSFESFSFPGWFIGSPSKEGHPITLTQERGKADNTDFHLHPED
ncbi:interleukin-36 beta [Choloepus didactylus]|uniref:interleukin-36 beta n=1 Tax=Choloepus didactylus TaxID=27675 RepID=UPI00189F5850|nr:interleukin-36 beta [Choloepus didactylus]